MTLDDIAKWHRDYQRSCMSDDNQVRRNTLFDLGRERFDAHLRELDAHLREELYDFACDPGLPEEMRRTLLDSLGRTEPWLLWIDPKTGLTVTTLEIVRSWREPNTSQPDT